MRTKLSAHVVDRATVTVPLVRESSPQVLSIDREHNLIYAMIEPGMNYSLALIAFDGSIIRVRSVTAEPNQPRWWRIDPSGRRLYGITANEVHAMQLDGTYVGAVIRVPLEDSRVQAIAFDRAGNCHVLHTYWNPEREDEDDAAYELHVSVFDAEYRSLRTGVVTGPCTGAIRDAAVDELGNLIVTDINTNMLVVITPERRVVRRYHLDYDGPIHYYLALDGAGNFLVDQTYVLLLNQCGQIIRRFGTRATFCGRGGGGMVVDWNTGDLAVADYFSDQVLIVPRFASPRCTVALATHLDGVTRAHTETTLQCALADTWSRETHALMPEHVRSVVRTVMLLAYSANCASVWKSLPFELLSEIFSYLPVVVVYWPSQPVIDEPIKTTKAFKPHHDAYHLVHDD